MAKAKAAVQVLDREWVPGSDAALEESAHSVIVIEEEKLIVETVL
jgi:hypothetical protein